MKLVSNHCLCDFGLSILGVSPDKRDVDRWGVFDGLLLDCDSLLSPDDLANGLCLNTFLKSLVSMCTFDTMFDPYSPIAWALMSFFG